jgi:four helix bundle protein
MMQESENKHVYDLEERTFQFAKAVRLFIKKIPRTIANIEDAKQLVKSSGSTGANYIEANESLSPKDFLMRVKISRKEVKESAYWLRLIHETNKFESYDEIVSLMNEAGELLKILSAIINKHK